MLGAFHIFLRQVAELGHRRKLVGFLFLLPLLLMVLFGAALGGESVPLMPDGSQLAVAGGKVLIRDTSTGKVQGQLTGPSPWVYALAFDPAGGRLASGAVRGTTPTGSTATRRQVRH